MTEYEYHRLFKQYAPLVIPGCKSISVTSDRHNIPDAWIELEGERCPVEVKCLKFDEKALAQLQRYLDAYGAKRGVAVADKLTVELPENILFVSLEELMKVAKLVKRAALEDEMLGAFRVLNNDMQGSIIRIAKHMHQRRNEITYTPSKQDLMKAELFEIFKGLSVESQDMVIWYAECLREKERRITYA